MSTTLYVNSVYKCYMLYTCEFVCTFAPKSFYPNPFKFGTVFFFWYCCCWCCSISPFAWIQVQFICVFNGVVAFGYENCFWMVDFSLSLSIAISSRLLTSSLNHRHFYWISVLCFLMLDPLLKDGWPSRCPETGEQSVSEQEEDAKKRAR